MPSRPSRGCWIGTPASTWRWYCWLPRAPGCSPRNVPAMLAVLVASCPCALVLAAPATAVAAIAVAARHGILIKGSAFLEHLSDVSAVIFDKTGTMTTGDLRLSGGEAR